LDFIEKNKILVIVGASILGLLIVGFLLWGCRRANRKVIFFFFDLILILI